MGRTLYVDMDGVLADYDSRAKALSREYDGPEDPSKFKWHRRESRFYLKLNPVPGAVEAFDALSDTYDTYLLSTPSWHNPQSWTDKRLWVEEHLGEGAKKRLILAHDKHLLDGSLLIDDKSENSKGFSDFIHFGSPEWPDWETVLSFLL